MLHDRPAIAIATCLEFVGREQDDLQIIEALRRRGFEAFHVAWDDPVVNWSSFTLVVIRSTWNYPNRLRDFLSWAGRLPRVLNPLPILKWNTDKRYLLELSEAGLPVISTCFIDPGSVFEPPSVPFVVKPAVSCGARDTARYQPSDRFEAHEHVLRLHSSGRTVMIQPYLSNIELTGETAVIFIGGRYSHSIRRDAVLRHVGMRAESVVPLSNVRAYEPTDEERLLADQVMASVPGESSELLYGRVDMIHGRDGSPVLLELELTEPSLFLDFSSDGVDRLASSVASQVSN